MGVRSMPKHNSRVRELLPRSEPTLHVRSGRPQIILDEAFSRLLRSFDELDVALKVSKAQQRIATLPRSQVFSRAAQLEIALRDLEAVVTLVDHLEPVARQARKRFVVKQDAVACAGTAPDSSAQLVQLREAETLSALDHHQRGVRYIDSDFDYRGANQELGFPLCEI